MAGGSPIDDFEAPEQLSARVVTPGPRPRLHGYDVQDDLVRSYDFAEIVFTALVGRPPLRHEGRALNVLLGFLLPISVAEAPAHGAVLARICGARSQRVTAAAAVTLCEQARFELDRSAPLLEWLAGDRSGPPPGAREAIDPQEHAAVAALHERLREAGLPAPCEGAPLSLHGAILAGLFACGLTHAWQLEVLWCLCRLPAATAEAMTFTAGSFAEYPIRRPAFALEPREDGSP
jgi:hypothetical protein